MSYEHGKYGMIERKWFGRPLTKGGDAAAGIVIAGSGTTSTKVKLFLPKGPINVEKVGVQVVATLASAANATGSVNNQRMPIRFYKGTPSTPRQTLLGSVHVVMGDGGRTALWGIASLTGTNLASQEVEAGKYITIYQATANSDNGTVNAVIATHIRTGTLAYFMDYRPKDNLGGKWDGT